MERDIRCTPDLPVRERPPVSRGYKLERALLTSNVGRHPASRSRSPVRVTQPSPCLESDTESVRLPMYNHCSSLDVPRQPLQRSDLCQVSKKVRDPGFAESKVWDLYGSWTLLVLFAVGLWKPRNLKIVLCRKTLETQDLKILIVARPWKPRTLQF